MTASQTTTDHDTIRSWADARGGKPSRVDGTAPGGVLRIDFGEPEERLEAISWEEFLQVFESRSLAFLYQENTESGGTSRFNKFVDRET